MVSVAAWALRAHETSARTWLHVGGATSPRFAVI
jgi:hypothetical protein